MFYLLTSYSLASLTFTAAMSLTSVALMGAWLSNRPELAVPKSYLRWAAALSSACFLSLIVAKFWPHTEAGRAPEIHLLGDFLKAWLLFLPLPVAAAFKDLSKTRREQVLNLWLTFAALMSAIGIVQFFTGWPRAQPIPLWAGRFHATLLFGHHLSTASILLFPFFFALGRKRYVVSAWIAVGILLSWSRTAWVVLPLTSLLWAVRYVPKKARTVSILGLLGGVVLLGALAYQYAPIRYHMTDRMGHSERFELWETDLKVFSERPILGGGWRKTPELAENHFSATDPGHPHFSGHAHNNVIEMLTGTGILGTLAWFFFNAFLFRFAWRNSRGSTPEARMAWAFFCAWVALHLSGLTQMNFWEGKVLHQMMLATGFLFAIIRRTSRRR